MGPGPRQLLDEAAAGRLDVVRREADEGTVFVLAGRPFAVLRGSAAEFRLRPDMVRAALRTPGTTASPRGPEWVAFTPPEELDRYDVDRLTSWFEMAARLAGG